MSPLVTHRFGEYMMKHTIQADGERRSSDNWQKGISLAAYMKSLWRHFTDVWLYHRGFVALMREPIEDALCAVLFNTQGYLHELIKKRLKNEEDDRMKEAEEKESSK
jgi:hypothetical protein